MQYLILRLPAELTEEEVCDFLPDNCTLFMFFEDKFMLRTVTGEIEVRVFVDEDAK